MICSNRVGGAKLLQANGEQLWKCFSPYSIIVSRGAQGLRGSFGQWCIMKQFPRPDSVTYTSARILTKTPLSRNGGEDFFREVLTAYEYVSKWEQAWCSQVLTQSSTEDRDDGNHKDGKRCYSLAGITPTIDMYKKTLNLLGQLRPTIAFLPWKLGDFLLAQRRRLLLGPLKVGYTVLIYVSSCSIGVRYLHPGVFFLFLICELLKLLRSSLLAPEAAVGKRSSFADETGMLSFFFLLKHCLGNMIQIGEHGIMHNDGVIPCLNNKAIWENTAHGNTADFVTNLVVLQACQALQHIQEPRRSLNYSGTPRTGGIQMLALYLLGPVPVVSIQRCSDVVRSHNLQRSNCNMWTGANNRTVSWRRSRKKRGTEQNLEIQIVLLLQMWELFDFIVLTILFYCKSQNCHLITFAWWDFDCLFGTKCWVNKSLQKDQLKKYKMTHDFQNLVEFYPRQSR